MAKKIFGPSRTIVAIGALATVLACGEDRPPTTPTGPAGPPASILRINFVTPGFGGSATNTTITIQGAGFESGSSLTLDGVATPATFLNTTNLRAVAGPHAPGPIDVVVTNPNGESSRLTAGFRYVEQPVSLTLSGNTSLQAIGDTSQLTATAVFSDGTTRDVTREGQWTSSFPNVASISSDGVVTARGLGITPILLRYPVTDPSVYRSIQVAITPAGTFTVTGRVREPGAGSVAGARILHLDSGESVLSNTEGYYFLAGLTGRPRFRFTKPDYEDAEVDVPQSEFSDAPLQRVIHIEAGGSTYYARLAPNDMDYAVAGETHCQPCRLIRVSNPASGTQVKLTWTGSATLQIWVNGRAFRSPDGQNEVFAEVPAATADILIFVGRSREPFVEDYIPFSVTAFHGSGSQ